MFIFVRLMALLLSLTVTLWAVQGLSRVVNPFIDQLDNSWVKHAVFVFIIVLSILWAMFLGIIVSGIQALTSYVIW